MLEAPCPPAETLVSVRGGSGLLARGRPTCLPGDVSPVAFSSGRSEYARASHSGGAAPDSHRLPG